ncbi:hypothetical protein [Roseinatronobacter bogoriensis]|uniref:hypothetical protein n=1 Tax=Roseinatronobacter bogoriensis TaxID=119542 RepID=UPI001065C2F0|nr:hypothetical protein [Rhodobaca bogoriensis]MBB4207292.1 hypothetical protein [Rhodobaca bogoriensis DSM 18756]TDY65790.1 hypothetical protein EV660_11758 [Rhodobaca bogoriensis DSM 18756]
MPVGFFLDMESPTTGVGFVNPRPLPVFPAGITKLHRLFKTPGKSNVNRIPRQPGDLQFTGVQFDADGILSGNASQDWYDMDGSEYIGGAWTYALIVDLANVNIPNNIAFSTDFSGSGRRGFRITAAEHPTRDLTLQCRAYSGAGEANAQLSFDRPSERFLLTIARFDGAAASLDVPHWSGLTRITNEAAGDPGQSPLTTAGLRFPRKDGPDNPPSGVGYAAYAAWGRALTDAETDDAIAALYSWARGLGIDV